MRRPLWAERPLKIQGPRTLQSMQLGLGQDMLLRFVQKSYLSPTHKHWWYFLAHSPFYKAGRGTLLSLDFTSSLPHHLEHELQTSIIGNRKSAVADASLKRQRRDHPQSSCLAPTCDANEATRWLPLQEVKLQAPALAVSSRAAPRLASGNRAMAALGVRPDVSSVTKFGLYAPTVGQT
jgi:hypothetical protein